MFSTISLALPPSHVVSHCPLSFLTFPTIIIILYPHPCHPQPSPPMNPIVHWHPSLLVPLSTTILHSPQHCPSMYGTSPNQKKLISNLKITKAPLLGMSLRLPSQRKGKLKPYKYTYHICSTLVCMIFIGDKILF